MVYDRFKDPKHIKWAKAVKSRDNYSCVICGKNNVYLHSHHLNSWDKFPEQRFLVENGVTLCADDHKLFHLENGLGNNTRHQFQEHCEMLKLLKAMAKEKILIKKIES